MVAPASPLAIRESLARILRACGRPQATVAGWRQLNMQHRPYNHPFSAFHGGRVGSIGREGRQVPGVMIRVQHMSIGERATSASNTCC